MGAFLVALGLMFVIEGAMYALFPDGMRKMMERIITLPTAHIRAGGIVFAIFGFLIIATLKGL